MVPSDTALAIVPLDKTIASSPNEKKAATGNDRKLAAANPNADNNAIQQKMIPKPRKKFSPNPPSGYSTSMPSSKGNNSATLFGLMKLMVRSPVASNRFGSI